MNLKKVITMKRDLFLNERKELKPIPWFIFSLILAIFCYLLPFFIQWSCSDRAFYIDLKPKTLRDQIDELVETEKTPLEQLLKDYHFEDDERRMILNFKNNGENNFLDMTNVLVLLKHRFSGDIKGEIKPWKDRWQDISLSSFILLILYTTTLSLCGYSYNLIKKVSNDLKKEKKSFLETIQQDRKCDLDRDVIVGWQGEISNEFKTTIEKFYNAHEGFIQGIYNNYPHNFSETLDKKKCDFMPLRTGPRGLYIIMRDMDPSDYSQLALKLLSITNQKVQSATYFENEDFLKQIKKTGDYSLRNWLEEVNKKKTENPKFRINRVHIFNEKKEQFKFKNFKELLNADKKAKELYNKYFIFDNNECFYTYELSFEARKKLQREKLGVETKSEMHFFGEYVIFDGQVLLKYDQEFFLIELYVGSVVKDICKFFDNAKELSNKQILSMKYRDSLVVPEELAVPQKSTK